MATKFGTKSAIIRLVQEISLRALRLSGVIDVGLSIKFYNDPGCHGNEI